jgi:hypothetical protein
MKRLLVRCDGQRLDSVFEGSLDKLLSGESLHPMMEAPVDFQIPVPRKRGSGKLKRCKKVVWRLAVPEKQG